MKAEIKKLTIPEKFKLIKEDLIYTHTVKEIKFGKENIDILPLMTDVHFVYPLAEFLKERQSQKLLRK